MKWVTYRSRPDGVARTGIVLGDRIHSLEPSVQLLGLIGDPEAMADAAERARKFPYEVSELSGVILLAPIPRPPSIRDFYAFEQHVKTGHRRRGVEVDPYWYEAPVFYFTNPVAVTGPYDPVRMPFGTAQLDFELEVAAVVGRGGANLSPEAAETHIAGYMVMNDWSARDIQRREMRVGLGPAKGKDFATTLGPWLVTPDELEARCSGKAFDLVMTARVNGREYSRAKLSEIHWSFAEMIAYASRGTELVPGDVLGSGTCGNGCIAELSFVASEAEYPWLQVGDQVELTVELLGTVSNRIEAPLE